MKKIIERILIFLIGIPAVFALVFLLPYYRHLALNMIVVLFSAVGAIEFSVMLEKKGIHISKIKAATLGTLAPLTAVLIICFNVSELLISILLMSVSLWALLSQAFSRNAGMEGVIRRLAGYFSVMIYPGFFMYWLVKMSSMEYLAEGSNWQSSGAIFLFLLIVFGNDSAAWLCGTLLGKNNKGLIPASPNKSIAGYIGGLAGAIIVSVGAALLFPFIFPEINLKWIIIIGVFTALAGSLGDLAESAMKRSCDFKDSGNMMLGRGGILDSIDSICVAAPVYYFFFTLFFLR